MSCWLIISRHAFRTTAARTTRLGKLLLDDCLLGMDLIVEELSSQLVAIINLYLQ